MSTKFAVPNYKFLKARLMLRTPLSAPLIHLHCQICQASRTSEACQGAIRIEETHQKSVDSFLGLVELATAKRIFVSNSLGKKGN